MALFPKKLEKNLSERKSKKFPAKNGGMKFGFALNYQYSCVLECVLLELISELPRGLNMNSWYLYNIGSSLNSVQIQFYSTPKQSSYYLQSTISDAPKHTGRWAVCTCGKYMEMKAK